MSNSSLATYTGISPNKTSPREHAIDTITIHCFVGQVTAKRGCEVFQPTTKKASCNYVVGYDGSIGLCVEEKDRSWCSSNAANDNRAVTIEVASDTSDPYAVTEKAYAALLDLVTDICRRNGIRKLVWSTNKSDRVNHRNGCNMTVHRDYANKACPGEYLYSRHGQIAEEVNSRLASDTGSDTGSEGTEDTGIPAVPFTVKVLIDDLNIRAEPAMSGAVKGQTGKGTFTIVEVSDGWGKLKSGAGWIWLGNAEYCTILGSTAAEEESELPYKVRVTATGVCIRAGAGTDTAIVGECPAGVYTIVEEADGAGAKKWGRLKSGAGWIAIDDTEKV